MGPTAEDLSRQPGDRLTCICLGYGYQAGILVGNPVPLPCAVEQDTVPLIKKKKYTNTYEKYHVCTHKP